MAHRPLSPHLFIYRFAYTMALSILHRITGLALAAGLIVLAIWLMALAGGPDSYARFQQFAGSWLFAVLIALWVIAFVLHFCNGIRHLFWDAGMGLERPQARRSAAIVVVLVVLLSLLLLYGLFSKVYP
ncbi:MAG: succinate dehydrogenase, cytochrome b556 subunit [Steroidobacteraceae bacterium]